MSQTQENCRSIVSPQGNPDRNHVVTAEGFSPEELDERIKDAEEAEVVTNKIARLASEAEENPSGQLTGELRAVSEK
ncbi:MAG: hypothetical protein ACYST6_07515 [Planctomycetota bacterium]|jgi:hypothetical protein